LSWDVCLGWRQVKAKSYLISLKNFGILSLLHQTTMPAEIYKGNRPEILKHAKAGKMNTMWLVVMCISVLFAVINGRTEEFTKAMFEAGKAAAEICIYLLGIVSLWLGLTKILEESGLMHKLSNFFRPAISLMFGNIPKGHPAITSITLNLLANFLGIGNAATPLGIKAMEDLQTLNGQPDTVTFDMMLFIVINTSSIQLIPFTVIGLLANYGSSNPNWIFLPTFISTVISSVIAVGILFLFKKSYNRTI
jgi:spore maturation protein A